MRRDYDVFEKFPDGSTVWRANVSGLYEAQRKVQELREFSENEFYILDIQTELISPRMAGGSRFTAKAAASG